MARGIIFKMLEIFKVILVRIMLVSNEVVVEHFFKDVI